MATAGAVAASRGGAGLMRSARGALPGRLRSLLFAPANRLDLVAKLPRSGPDGVVIDLEDAVPAAGKAAARLLVPGGVRLVLAASGAPPVFVRVNPLGGEHHSADLAALEPGLTGVVLPKVSSREDVRELRNELDERGLEALAIIAGIESAAGVASAREIARAGIDVLYFGAEDFITDMGGERTASNREVLYARSEVALAARLGDVLGLDQVVVDIQDHDRLRRECEEARALGYGGKLCIHPGQVGVANEAFMPGAEEIERSRRMVAAFDAGRGESRGVIDFEGQMVDEPVVRRARAVLLRAGLVEDGGGGVHVG